jgi:hypothetical protein
MAKPLTDVELKAELAVIQAKCRSSDRALAAGTAIPSVICKRWPAAKAVLTLLKQTGSWYMKLICNVILQIGNALYAQCPVSAK